MGSATPSPATPGSVAQPRRRIARAASPQTPARALAKARTAADCEQLEQLPNVGPSIAGDLRSLGIARPRQLATEDPFVLYQSLCTLTGKRHDPCVLDTFMAAVDFMRGAEALPWWHYTPQRKALYGAV